MMYPLVRDLAADAIPVAVTCRVLGFSKQAFYAWCANPVTRRDWDDAHLINAALDIHHDDPEFGYRFITDELADRGIVASRNRVNRLCTARRIFSVHSRKRGLARKPGPPVHDDLVERQFTADEPNTLWLTDMTEHPTGEGKLYLCAVTPSTAGPARPSDGRLLRRPSTSTYAPPYKPVLRPSLEPEQFRSHAYVRALRGHGLNGSMGRVGACADNAAMESFFSLLQKTCWTANAGPPATSCGWRSPPGSKRPTTAAGDKTASARSPP